MKIAVDVMGGDDAPQAILEGIKRFIETDRQTHIVLVGPKDTIESELKKQSLSIGDQLSIVEANETIGMGESPVKAIRSKKNASMCVMIDLAKKEEVDAVLSAGNTGAMVAASTLKLRTLPGIDRPGIATVMPTAEGKNLLMDVGAVTNCKPKNYTQFAVMGSCFARLIMDIPSPSIGLLNVGEEDSKGDELTKEVFSSLKDAPINFKGNVEGRDIFKSTVNVIVTNGFVGNIVLKACESLAKSLFLVLKKQITKNFISKLGAFLLKGALKKVVKQFDHEEYGGAMLLGVKGVVIIAHGSSTARSISNALCVARKIVEKKVNQEITNLLENT